MTNKELQPNIDYILHDGEIYFISKEENSENDLMYRSDTRKLFRAEFKNLQHGSFNIVTHTTNPTLQGVKQLDRKLFVKKEDPFYKAEDYARARYNREELTSACISGYMAAHYANKKEFTREDMLEAMKYASSHLSSVKGINAYLDALPKLSLPTSITIDNDIIKVKF